MSIARSRDRPKNQSKDDTFLQTELNLVVIHLVRRRIIKHIAISRKLCVLTSLSNSFHIGAQHHFTLSQFAYSRKIKNYSLLLSYHP